MTYGASSALDCASVVVAVRPMRVAVRHLFG